MEPTTDRPRPKGTLRRYLPLVVVVLVVAVAIGAFAVFAGDDGGDGDSTEASSGAEGREPVLFDADADVDWGPSCDTETGRVAIPTRFAAPCVEPWTDDNGGATAPGVTDDSIRVVIYQAPPDPIFEGILSGAGVDDSPEEVVATMQAYVDIFSEFYETYGRTVELVPFAGSGNGTDEVAARNDALQIVDELDPFAVWGGPAQTASFGDEITANGILCLGGCTGLQQISFTEDRAPYAWPVGSVSQGNAHLVEWIEKQVAGRPAEFAGDPALQGQERSFGLLAFDTASGVFEESREITAADFEARDLDLFVVPYQLDLTRAPESARTMVAQLKDAGVTTVIFAGDPLMPIYLTDEATRQGYFPEWIPVGLLTDTNFFARQYDPQQWAHAFAPVDGPVRIAREQSTSYRLHEWYFGEPPAAAASNALWYPLVWQFMTGVHLAGPDLTADTFRAGLFRFPPSGGTTTEPAISFGEQGVWDEVDYAGTDDRTEIWYDPAAEGTDETGQTGPGMYRWSDGGRRYLPGEWPDSPSAAFREEGSVILYEQPPEDEAPPDYPSPAAG